MQSRSPLDVARGYVAGGRSVAVDLTSPPRDPAEALVAAVLDAMRGGPTLVSFSGGLDSSLVLAAATLAARRHGLSDPIPISWRAADALRSHESPWQEAVVQELGLRDWIRLDASDELDYIGPVAARVVGRHGVCVPANVHLHEPLLARAAGGTLLTGIGGDQLFGLWHWRLAADLLARRSRPSVQGLRQLTMAALPIAARRQVAGRRRSSWPTELEWLSGPQAAAFARVLAEQRVDEPASWSRRVPWQAGRHQLRALTTALDAMAASHHARADHPLLAPPLVAAVARAGGRLGFPNRGTALRALFPELLPAAVATRRTKAVFDEVFNREQSRQAAAAWDGTGVDPSIVDVPALQAIWRSGRVPLRTAALLQQVTLQRPTTPSPPR